jgi:NAD(P)-dependent dehydrogenase (short-subunit alcohol dehydrogenase family)
LSPAVGSMGSVAVVTGASRGLGAALASDLASRGFALGLCATSEPAAHGALCAAVDVADATAVERFAADVAGTIGPIDLWINNAGILGPVGWMRTVAAGGIERCINVNLLGVINGTRAFLTHRSTGHATLVNIASKAGVTGAPGLAVHSATKAAVIALTTSVAQEEHGSGLRAFAILPPAVDTDLQNVLLSQDETDFPLVRQVRQRKRDGEVVAPDVAAAWILDGAFADHDRPTVVDLTQQDTG